MKKILGLNLLGHSFWLAALFVFVFSPLTQAEMKGLQDFKGNPQVLENYTGKGKWLIVMLWASDCYICNKEAHQYVDFHLIHADEDATVLGISLDGESRKKEAENFIEKHNIDFPNLIAEPEYVSAMYKNLTDQFFSGTPTFLIFSPDGKLKATQAGAVPTSLIEDFIKKNSSKKVSKK